MKIDLGVDYFWSSYLPCIPAGLLQAESCLVSQNCLQINSLEAEYIIGVVPSNPLSVATIKPYPLNLEKKQLKGRFFSSISIPCGGSYPTGQNYPLLNLT